MNLIGLEKICLIVKILIIKSLLSLIGDLKFELKLKIIKKVF